MTMRILSIFTMFLIFSGCSTTSNMKAWHDPELDQNGGITIIVDTCIIRDEVGEGESDDYFVIRESMESSKALYDASRKYLVDNGVQVRKGIIPFVCGAVHDEVNSKKLVAEEVNGEVKDIKQPFGVKSEIMDDAEYLSALSEISTYVAQYESGAQSTDLIFGSDELIAAANVIADRTKTSKVLFLNVAGTSISGGKAFGQAIGGFFIGLGTAVATAGLGTGYYGYYVPGGDVDVVYLGAAVVDLDARFISWSNSTRVDDDPIDPDVITDAETTKLLLFDLVNKSAAELTLADENVQILKQHTGNKAHVISMLPPKEYDGKCRSSVPIRNVVTVHRPVQEAINRVLNSAGVYDFEYGIKLSGSLDKIEFSSGATGGWWDMELSLSNEDGQSITVQSHYDFESSFGGSAACQQTKEAFGPAIQNLIKDTVNNPAFYELLNRNVSILDQPSM